MDRPAGLKDYVMTMSIKTILYRLIAACLLGSLAAQAQEPARRGSEAAPVKAQQADGSAPKVAPRALTVQEWQGRLMAELQRRKRYPDALVKAARKAEEATPSGVATLAFVLDRTGKVVESSISVGSGRPEFDTAALAMAPLGEVLAPPPPSVVEEQIKLTVPVRFVGSPAKPVPVVPQSP